MKSKNHCSRKVILGWCKLGFIVTMRRTNIHRLLLTWRVCTYYVWRNAVRYAPYHRVLLAGDVLMSLGTIYLLVLLSIHLV